MLQVALAILVFKDQGTVQGTNTPVAHACTTPCALAVAAPLAAGRWEERLLWTATTKAKAEPQAQPHHRHMTPRHILPVAR